MSKSSQHDEKCRNCREPFTPSDDVVGPDGWCFDAVRYCTRACMLDHEETLRDDAAHRGER